MSRERGTAVTGNTVLVTGGSGYFGSLLAAHLKARGDFVRTFDVATPDDEGSVEFVRGDIRDPDAVRDACKGVDVVFHNVAMVPLARDRALFSSVNVGGTANLLVAARDAGVRKVVHTSSSAVFGIPDANPVFEDTTPRPVEAYGRAKLRAELLCRSAAEAGLDVTIIRPRTIMGHGRLGIAGLLFDWVADGSDVYVLGSGDNRYQFVHADDLAIASVAAADRPGPAVYNIGAAEFGTMRETLEALVVHAGTGSRVRSLPAATAAAAMRVFSAVGLAPFAAYHWMLYGRSLWFDIGRARRELSWEPKHSSVEMFIESYEWFLARRGELTSDGDASQHRSLVRQGALGLLKAAGRLHLGR